MRMVRVLIASDEEADEMRMLRMVMVLIASASSSLRLRHAPPHLSFLL
jgi:hypothetical protein